MVGRLAWWGTIVHGFNVLEHGFHMRDGAYCVERLLTVGVIKEETVGVEVFKLAGEKNSQEFLVWTVPLLED